MGKQYETDNFGNYVIVIREFSEIWPHAPQEVFRGVKAELESSKLPREVKVQGFAMTTGSFSTSTHMFHKEDYSDHLRRVELDSLALASSKMKLNKVAESLSYDAGTIHMAALKMENIVRRTEEIENWSMELKGLYTEPVVVEINTLMSHSESPTARAAIATAYHNMKTSENRLN